MTSALFYLLVLLISLLFAWLLYRMAEKRGKHKVFWAAMGFLFGPLAIPFLIFTNNSPEL